MSVVERAMFRIVQSQSVSRVRTECKHVHSQSVPITEVSLCEASAPLLKELCSESFSHKVLALSGPSVNMYTHNQSP
jgi:hypothetical protein